MELPLTTIHTGSFHCSDQEMIYLRNYLHKCNVFLRLNARWFGLGSSLLHFAYHGIA